MSGSVTEREKMLAGEPYDSRDPELLEMYHRARGRLANFNRVSSRDTDGKAAVLGALLGHLGRAVWIESPFFCDYGCHIGIGDNCFVNANCTFLDCNRITIGANTLIGPAVQLLTSTHAASAAERLIFDDPDDPGRARYVTRALPVEIGPDCWIGAGAIVLPGVSIGAGATIGAGSVVTRPVPANVLAQGSPARVVRSLEPARR
jgi:maltose O-acetyltransferase